MAVNDDKTTSGFQLVQDVLGDQERREFVEQKAKREQRQWYYRVLY
jgi:hypothetical protein